jgi:hypothetical protein
MRHPLSGTTHLHALRRCATAALRHQPARCNAAHLGGTFHQAVARFHVGLGSEGSHTRAARVVGSRDSGVGTRDSGVGTRDSGVRSYR